MHRQDTATDRPNRQQRKTLQARLDPDLLDRLEQELARVSREIYESTP